MIVESADREIRIWTPEAVVLLLLADESQQIEREIVFGLLPMPAVGQARSLSKKRTRQADQQLAEMLKAQPTRKQVLPLIGNGQPNDLIGDSS